MVSALHDAGIAVILDVVYNHTAEGGHEGPTLSFRGIDHAGYYRLTSDLRNDYDVTGCGNAVDTSNPRVLQLVLDSLRYWVTEMGVDGFRFDLCTTLIRDEQHHVQQDHAFKEALATDPVLSKAVLIAEPWDLGPYGYQVGRWGQRLERVERPLPRLHPRLLARRHPRRRGARHPAGRLGRHLRPRRAPGDQLGQLRHRPRRLHPPRRGHLRPQAQRGQRRAQPRRRRRQPLLEPRLRGRDRRRGDQRRPPPDDAQHDGDAAAVDRACRWCWPATRWAAPSRATTTPTARTPRCRGCTGPTARSGTNSSSSPAPCSRCAPSTRSCGRPTSARGRRSSATTARGWAAPSRPGSTSTAPR